MAKRGTVKRRSVEQEEDVAQAYEGTRSPSSGAADTDRGDVRTRTQLIECRFKGSPGEKEAYSYSITVKALEKIADEARAEGRDGVIAIRLYAPESVLADQRGNVDFVARLLVDDVSLASIQDSLAEMMDGEV